MSQAEKPVLVAVEPVVPATKKEVEDLASNAWWRFVLVHIPTILAAATSLVIGVTGLVVSLQGRTAIQDTREKVTELKKAIEEQP